MVGSLPGCGFGNDGKGVAEGLVGGVHDVVGINGFLIRLFALGVGMVDFFPGRKDEDQRVVTVREGSILKVGRDGLMCQVGVGEGVGDASVEEKGIVT